MKISRILVYPVKSLRPYEPSSAEVTKYGFSFDRRFMLLQQQPDGTLKNMHVAHYPELVLLFATIAFSSETPNNPSTAKIIITHRPPQGPEKIVDVPLTPSIADLDIIDVEMHKSATKAYNMGSPYNDFLSSCLGYSVVLAYLGPNYRSVLMTSPNSPAQTTSSSWYSGLSSKLPTSITKLMQNEEDKITFADCAPYLVVSETSMRDVHTRLPDGEEMDITKFRPNIIIEGADKVWEEDYWSELAIGGGAKLLLLQNCARCQSVNIDYATGKPGTGESGKILKKMQSDRRVDAGAKYSPIFGRYSFLEPSSEGMTVRVGDEVTVTKRNAERTIFDWKGLATS